MTKKNTAKDFGKMVSEFGKNWKTIKDKAKEKQKILDKYK